MWVTTITTLAIRSSQPRLHTRGHKVPYTGISSHKLPQRNYLLAEDISWQFLVPQSLDALGGVGAASRILFLFGGGRPALRLGICFEDVCTAADVVVDLYIDYRLSCWHHLPKWRAWRKTAVTPVRQQWSYRSLALRHCNQAMHLYPCHSWGVHSPDSYRHIPYFSWFDIKQISSFEMISIRYQSDTLAFSYKKIILEIGRSNDVVIPAKFQNNLSLIDIELISVVRDEDERDMFIKMRLVVEITLSKIFIRVC